MNDCEHLVPPPSERDEALIKRLRDIARERDRVPEEVLAAARALFPRARDERAGAASDP
jgi:hypothetical protein